MKCSNCSLTNKVLAVIAMIALVVGSNYGVEFSINSWLTWGAFPYPFTFLVTELIQKTYGKNKAREIVYWGFCVCVGVAFLWMNRRIALASSLAFLFAHLLNVWIFDLLSKEKWWVAPVFSALVASAFDTVLFFSLAFWGEKTSWAQLALGDFAVKVPMIGVSVLLYWFVTRRGLAPGQVSLESPFEEFQKRDYLH